MQRRLAATPRELLSQQKDQNDSPRTDKWLCRTKYKVLRF